MEVVDLDEPTAATSGVSLGSTATVSRAVQGKAASMEKGSAGEDDGGAHDVEDGAGHWRCRPSVGAGADDGGGLARRIEGG